ncbi:aminotransferase class V-fold PLP-dependent enzyme [Pseudaestuariivita sp.]|uniref:aminotransferase class V-fold PLP-dependent enzyme n=1 Tax=Pseudaestuariivita sp. TaxID=2211669 RepID=UPI00405A1EFB
MIESTPGPMDPDLLNEVRGKFAHVDACPFTGPRVFFENAGGALTLNSVVETSAQYAAIPDNQGRDNPASKALMDVIAKGKEDMRTFFNAPDGQVFVGESGTEVLFRLVRAAAFASAGGGVMLGSTLEHPASRSAMHHWASRTGREHVLVPHDDATGTVTVGAYRAALTPEVRVATIVATSPVTGKAVDVSAIANAIRTASPDCLIVVDGIQHASHGRVDVTGVDGYAVSPYKMFSRHGYGVGWASERMEAGAEALQGTAPGTWELGTRDTGAYATFSDVVDYLRWLGAETGGTGDDRALIEAAADAIHAQEAALTDAMLHGTGNHPGLTQIEGVTLIGGTGAREGVISLTLDRMPAAALVDHLNARGIRTHIRKNDHYCGNVLGPLGLEECIRVSYSHYNTHAEVVQFLDAMAEAAR